MLPRPHAVLPVIGTFSGSVMRKPFVLLSAMMAALLPPASATARRDADRPVAQQSPYELVVFEADGCIYCDSFRRDVLPLYRESQIGRETPIRFVNVSRSDETRMGLSSAITVAPTVVLMSQGQEIDRIVGYTGPVNFMKIVAHMMGRGE
jgi:thioredoxin-related protein